MEQGREADAETKLRERFVSTVVIGACIIAAVRLARDENIHCSSPRLAAVINDSVGLDRAILRKVTGGN